MLYVTVYARELHAKQVHGHNRESRRPMAARAGHGPDALAAGAAVAFPPEGA